MIKHSAAVLAGAGDRKTALIDMERARIAWEALTRHILDNDMISDFDMTALGTTIYTSITVPMDQALFADDDNV